MLCGPHAALGDPSALLPRLPAAGDKQGLSLSAASLGFAALTLPPAFLGWRSSGSKDVPAEAQPPQGRKGGARLPLIPESHVGVLASSPGARMAFLSLF